jgi:Arc/MetJ family transcription regulator
MATNLGIDERLLEQAVDVGGRPTKRETVNEALEEYIRRRKRRGFVGLFGTVDFRTGWDYKRERRRR